MAYEDDQPVTTPVRRSLIRPDLLFGCEAGPLVMAIAMAFANIMILHTFPTVIIGVIIAVTAVPVLRFAAKRDPYLSRVWIRSLRKYKQAEYQAHPDICGQIPYLPLEVR